MNLACYDNSSYKPGSKLKVLLWLIASRLFIESRITWPSIMKVFILRLFGANLGEGVVIKPCVKIKYPWFLEVGDNTWIGEKVWIDNLTNVKIGNNCCLSQGVYLLTGNHDYKSTKFDLITSHIEIQDSSWIGAMSIVCPGVRISKGAILSVNSVANKNLEENGIYQGNPAVYKRSRNIIT